MCHHPEDAKRGRGKEEIEVCRDIVHVGDGWILRFLMNWKKKFSGKDVEKIP